MKILITSLATAAALSLSLTGCKPESIDPERLSFILEQNNKLRQSIQNMQITIDEAGVIDASLTPRIEKLEEDIKESITELNNLSDAETASQIRVLELEERLVNFNAAFDKMQKQVTTAAQH